MSVYCYFPKETTNSDSKLPYIVPSLSAKEVNKIVSASLAEKEKLYDFSHVQVPFFTKVTMYPISRHFV